MPKPILQAVFPKRTKPKELDTDIQKMNNMSHQEQERWFYQTYVNPELTKKEKDKGW